VCRATQADADICTYVYVYVNMVHARCACMMCVYLCIALHLRKTSSSFVFFCLGLADGLIQVRSEFFGQLRSGSCELALEILGLAFVPLCVRALNSFTLIKTILVRIPRR
jgi:hypothetical protein